MHIVSRQLLEHGVSTYQAGRYQDAVEYFTELLNYEPDNWQCRLHLAKAFDRAGKRNFAVHELTYIAEKCPTHELRIQALKTLRVVMMAS